MQHQSIETHSSSQSFWMISVIMLLFFLSGGSAILYQVVWHRVLYATFGINIEAVTIIVSVFMFGLGLGSLVGGWLSSRFEQHLIGLFFIFEVGIGLFGIYSIQLIKAVAGVFAAYPTWVLPIAVFIITALPTLFMGATLPILVHYLSKTKSTPGQIVSRLYFINTLGSAIFCFACVVLIFRLTGLSGTLRFAAIINFAVAAAALLLSLVISRLKSR